MQGGAAVAREGGAGAKPTPRRAPSRPTAFPREDARTAGAAKRGSARSSRRSSRRKKQALGQARKELAEQESIRNGDERNYARVLERLQTYKDAVELHEKNIEALKRELANLNR